MMQTTTQQRRRRDAYEVSPAEARVVRLWQEEMVATALSAHPSHLDVVASTDSHTTYTSVSGRSIEACVADDSLSMDDVHHIVEHVAHGVAFAHDPYANGLAAQGFPHSIVQGDIANPGSCFYDQDTGAVILAGYESAFVQTSWPKNEKPDDVADIAFLAAYMVTGKTKDTYARKNGSLRRNRLLRDVRRATSRSDDILVDLVEACTRADPVTRPNAEQIAGYMAMVREGVTDRTMLQEQLRSDEVGYVNPQLLGLLADDIATVRTSRLVEVNMHMTLMGSVLGSALGMGYAVASALGYVDPIIASTPGVSEVVTIGLNNAVYMTGMSTGVGAFSSFQSLMMSSGLVGRAYTIHD